LLFHLDKFIPSDPMLLGDVVEEITAGLSRTAHWRDIEDIGLVVGEALANAMIHGNRCDPEKTVHVAVAVNEHGDLLVSVKDTGSGFDPSRLPNPTAPENLLAPHGRGIFLIRQLMDEVDFEFDHGTELRMRRRKK
jgi:serine/threonine-protein kinase RsbW